MGRVRPRPRYCARPLNFIVRAQMIEGPYSANRWTERIQKLEWIFSLLYLIAGVVWLAIFSYELLNTGEYLKLSVLLGVIAILGALLFAGLRPIPLLVLCTAFGVGFAFLF